VSSKTQNDENDEKSPLPRNETVPTRFSSKTAYVRSVLELYCRLPHTPNHPRPDDRFLARKLHQQRVPLKRLHAALLLGVARRLFRTETQPPLSPIRSLRYFLPVLEELRYARVDDAYLNYLRDKLQEFLSQTAPDVDPSSRPLSSTTQDQLSFDWSSPAFGSEKRGFT
jgi:hypothetical protein